MSSPMVLPDFVLPSRQHKHWKYSGIDSPDACFDIKYFLNYPHTVDYVYNSRGYRDQEWPSDSQLKDAVWCLGDSFTVGLGQPIDHIWPQQLQQRLDQRTINVSMDGASNFWIYRRAMKILEQIQPRIMILHWSYVTRGELSNNALTDEQRRVHIDPALIDHHSALTKFKDLVKSIDQEKKKTQLIHSFIPGFVLGRSFESQWKIYAGPDWPDFPADLTQFQQLPAGIKHELIYRFEFYKNFEIWFEILQDIVYVPEFDRLDLARDGNHYGLVTSEHFVSGIIKALDSYV